MVTVNRECEGSDGIAARGGEILACERLFGGGAEPLRGSLRQQQRRLVDRAELGPVPMHLLVVVGDGDVDFGTRLDVVLEVASDTFVQVGATALEEASVGGVAHQDVVEPVDGVVAGPGSGWFEEVLPAESIDEGTESAGDVAAGDRAEQPTVELGPDHGRELDDSSFVVGEALDATGEQREDGGWDLDRIDIDREMPAVAGAGEDAIVNEHLHEFADEQRVAFRGFGEAVDQVGRELVGVQQASGELAGGVRIEPFEPDRGGDVAPHLGELRAQLAQLWSGESEHHHRCRDPLREVVEQVPEQRLGPLDVVDDDQQGPIERQLFEQPTNRPERFLGRPRLAVTEERRQHAGQAFGLRVTGHQTGDVFGATRAVELAQEVDDRRERRRSAALEPQIEGSGGRTRSQLRGQPRLADARRTDDRRQPTRP